ncbi:MAG TPA: O-antigen ligase family protein [Candidatus Woesebacteria bacterium]|nr:O-antigen ligase family protein [Candidatus Woesebacteria bacterium]HNS94433.1 O-antigen ligase family protein [Candidatus Woesebacteria bacterium]
MEKVIRWIAQSVYMLLLLIVPLIMSTATSEMFEFPKILLIYAGASTVFVCWALLRLWYGLPVRRHTLLSWVGLFVVSQIIATITSIDPHTSIFGYYGRFNGGLASTVAYAVLFAVASQLFSKDSFNNLLRISIVASIIVLLWGLPGRLFGVDMSCILFRQEFSNACWTNEFRPHERMFSTLGQPNWLGVYFATHVFFGMYFVVRIWGQKNHSSVLRRNLIVCALGAYSMVMAWGVWLTASRSSQLGLGVGVLSMVFIYLWQYKRKSIVLVTSAMLLVIGIIFSIGYLSRIAPPASGGVTHSGVIRLIVWEGALKLALRYPLTGTGPETFAYSYFLTRPEAHNDTSERELIYNKAHNEPLHLLATSGMIGFITYAAMFWFGVRSMVRSREGVPFAASIVAMSLINFFGFSTTSSQLLMYLVLSWGVLASAQVENQRLRPAKLNPFVIRVIISIIIIGGWFMSLQYVYSYYLADTRYAQALNRQYAGEYVESVEAFVQALELRAEHVYANKLALTLAQTAYALGMADEQGEYVDSVLRYAKMAQDMQTRALTKSPRNPLYWKDRVKMYTLLIQVLPDAMKTEAEDNYNKALQQARLLAPTDLTVRTISEESAQ